MVSLDVLAHVATATLEETGEAGGYVVDEPQGDVEYVIEGGQVRETEKPRLMISVIHISFFYKHLHFSAQPQREKTNLRLKRA